MFKTVLSLGWHKLQIRNTARIGAGDKNRSWKSREKSKLFWAKAKIPVKERKVEEGAREGARVKQSRSIRLCNTKECAFYSSMLEVGKVLARAPLPLSGYGQILRGSKCNGKKTPCVSGQFVYLERARDIYTLGRMAVELMWCGVKSLVGTRTLRAFHLHSQGQQGSG